jgi:hypothetical protein
MRRLGVRIKPRRGRGGGGLLRRVFGSVMSGRKKTTTPTSGPEVAARHERTRARRLRPVGPARYAAHGVRGATRLVGRPGEKAERASGLRSGPNAEEGSSRPSGQKLRREKISISFSFL